MKIDDRLLDALADRWPNIPPDWRGQTFEAWVCVRMHYFNEFGYPFTDEHPWANIFQTLWDLVEKVPPADPDSYLLSEAEKLRQIGGTFVQRVEDLRPLVKVMLSIGA